MDRDSLNQFFLIQRQPIISKHYQSIHFSHFSICAMDIINQIKEFLPKLEPKEDFFSWYHFEKHKEHFKRCVWTEFLHELDHIRDMRHYIDIPWEAFVEHKNYFFNQVWKQFVQKRKRLNSGPNRSAKKRKIT